MRELGRCAAVLLLAVGTTTAVAGTSEQSADWPWMRRPKMYGYDERPPATPPPAQVTRPPQKYTITVTVSPQMTDDAKDKANVGVVMAYVPENARLWFNGDQTRQHGVLREYESPPLRRGKKYSYEVRLVWFEDGQWVSETKEVPVSAGEMSCVYLTKPSAMAAALAELPQKDRTLAEQQHVCPIKPETPLGAMGPPTKVMIAGEPVFLCCADCVEEARKHPEKTLAAAKELRSRNAETPRK